MLQVILTSKHQKARLIAPALAPLGYEVIESDAFDTDTLGTFSGEIRRTLSPAAAALTKARWGCESAHAPFGLGSEGSFGNGPYAGLLNWNDEILCLYERATQRAIYAHACGPFAPSGFALDGVKEPEQLAQKLAPFGEQRWIIKHDKIVHKGLTQTQVIAYLQQQTQITGSVEPDLRAMFSPIRQEMIAKAATDLARRLTATCPHCCAVDYVIKHREPGLSCAGCGMPTAQIKQYQYQCDVCQHSEIKASDTPHAAPMHCPLCNP